MRRGNGPRLPTPSKAISNQILQHHLGGTSFRIMKTTPNRVNLNNNNFRDYFTIDGKYSEWTNIDAGVPQGSLLGPILFLVFINDIVDVVESDIRIFADDTFIYRIMDQFSTEILNRDLEKISQWAWQWKLVFNPDITKQAVEVIFSNKTIPSDPLPLTFNDIPVKRVLDTKHLGLILDSKINFKKHIDDKLGKANKGIGVMKQMKKWVDMRALETVYKLYIRPHLEYGDLVFNSYEIGKSEIFNTFPRY